MICSIACSACTWTSINERERGIGTVGAAARYRLEQNGSPVAVGRLLDRLDREAAGLRPAHPFQHRRGVVVLQHQHAGTARNGQHLAGGRDAVADRGDQRHVDGIGSDQRRGRLACTLILLRLELRRKLPRLAFARHGGAAGLLLGFFLPERRRQIPPGYGPESYGPGYGGEYDGPV